MRPIINLGMLQHYTFCPRQWWLLAVEHQWTSNALTTAGDLVHALVDDPFRAESRGSVRIVRSLPVFCDELDLYGIADCVEFHRDGRIKVIEYKHGRPTPDRKIRDNDAMQLAGQMICVQSMFGRECSGAVFYHSIRRQSALCDFEAWRQRVLSTAEKMRQIMLSTAPPEPNCTTACASCSLVDTCLPRAIVRKDTRWRLQSAWEESTR